MHKEREMLSISSCSWTHRYLPQIRMMITLHSPTPSSINLWSHLDCPGVSCFMTAASPDGTSSNLYFYKLNYFVKPLYSKPFYTVGHTVTGILVPPAECFPGHRNKACGQTFLLCLYKLNFVLYSVKQISALKFVKVF